MTSLLIGKEILVLILAQHLFIINRKKLWHLEYEKGQLKNVKQNYINCVYPSSLPPNYTNWCVFYPPLCNPWNDGGGDTGGDPLDPITGMMNPPTDQGGSGAGAGQDYSAINAVMYQLNNILGPGDNYIFDNSVDPNNSLYFPTVADFQNFLSANAANQTSDLSTPATEIDANNKIEHGRFNLTFIGGVDISSKLEKVNNVWNLNQITSIEYGITLGWSWEQTSYSQSTSASEITVVVEGYAKYNVIIEAFGMVYKQFYKFNSKSILKQAKLLP
jgi:hypothetical protein